MPVVDSLADLNDKINQWDLDDENRHIDNHIRTVAQDFAFERTQLTPITAERSRASGVTVSLPGGRPKRFMSCREHSRRSGVGESR